MGIFSCQNMFLKSDENQLTPADIGLEHVNLVKIKHMGHLFHLVLDPELEFEGKKKKNQKIVIFVKFLKFDDIFEVLFVFEKLLFLPSNSSSVSKNEWKTCLISLLSTKLTNSSPMSADVS